jgi:hypothetical protein
MMMMMRWWRWKVEEEEEGARGLARENARRMLMGSKTVVENRHFVWKERCT